MAVTMTWSDLRALRLRGQRPSLRLIVTTSARFAHRMAWVGCASIVHESGTAMPVELLDGLDVILDLGNCDRASKVKRLCDSKGVNLARCEAWCQCAQNLTVSPKSCDEPERAWLAA